jgi:hypothetical protein
MSIPGVSAQLTALHLTNGGAAGLTAFHLDECSALRELVVTGCPSIFPQQAPDPDLPEHLEHLTALTKLVLKGCLLGELPDSLWSLKGLRHLSLMDDDIAGEIPSDISRLRQLQLLHLEHSGVQELPRDLGTWLPELTDLNISATAIRTVPTGLTRLTRLVASGWSVQKVSDIQHLVGLKELELEHTLLQPPIKELSRLTGLEKLHLDWAPSAAEAPGWANGWASVNLQGYWPRLRSLHLDAAPLELLCALPGVAGMAQLTYLSIDSLAADHIEAVTRLGVLPELRQAWLSTSSMEGTTCWGPAAAWLQQQPKLTELCLMGGMVQGMHLEQLPAQLEVLCLNRVQVPDEDLGHLTHLQQLQRLYLPTQLTQLPPWLSCLPCLEVLHMESSEGAVGSASGWEVLAEMPSLRQVRCCPEHLQHVPRLCWSLYHW